MATISSHTLNGTDGTHAGGIPVRLSRVGGETLFETEMDPGGRLARDVPPDRVDPAATYELVFHTAPYWQTREVPRDGPQIMSEIVLRFAMPDPEGRYHMPVILAPNSYSCWWSA